MTTTENQETDEDDDVCQVCLLIGGYLDAMLQTKPDSVDEAHVVGAVLRWGVGRLLAQDTAGGVETVDAVRAVLETWGLHIEVIPAGPEPERVQ